MNKKLYLTILPVLLFAFAFSGCGSEEIKKSQTCYEPKMTCKEALRIDFPEYVDKEVSCKLCRKDEWGYCDSKNCNKPSSCACYEVLEKGKDGQFSKTDDEVSRERLIWFKVKPSFYNEIECEMK